MPYLFMPCGWVGWPARRVFGLLSSSTPLDTPRRTPTIFCNIKLIKLIMPHAFLSFYGWNRLVGRSVVLLVFPVFALLLTPASTFRCQPRFAPARCDGGSSRDRPNASRQSGRVGVFTPSHWFSRWHHINAGRGWL
jgi:hypothetical protein